ncbi:MAG: restriction endonuclease subunit S [Acidobacteria bacterium]|nr:restriction endonuclease subunit S [Acidobacteriota bacterium]
MAVWRTLPIGDFCEIVSGATPSTTVQEYWDGDVPWVTPKDLSDLVGKRIHKTGREITKAGLASCSAALLPAGAVLLSSRAPIGHVAIAAVAMATNQGFKSLVPRSDTAEPTYLYWWLKAHRSHLESLGNGATFKEISKATVARVEVPLPPLAEQRRIADILDRADAMRAKRREAIALLDSLTQAVFVDMFGAPDGGSINGATATIDDVSEVITGYPFRSHEYVEDDDAVRLCRGANVLPDRFDWSDLARWPGEKLQGLSQFLLRPGDIVLAMDRPWISEGFKVARVRDDHCPALLVQRVARLRFETRAIGDFVFHLLKQPAFARHCRPTETTIPHISPIELRSFRFSLPPSDALEQYSARTQTVEQMKAAHYESLAEMDALFASLQHRAFRGEL